MRRTSSLQMAIVLVVAMTATLLCAVTSDMVRPSLAPQTSLRFVNPPSLPAPTGYTHVVEVPSVKRLIYISGQVPLDKDGKLVGAGDSRRQAEQVFENLEKALAAAGATFADVVKINYYVVDVASQLVDIRAVRDQHVNKAAPPASTLVEVRRLFRDGVLLEVEAVAAVGK